jgi:hypothetical protein
MFLENVGQSCSRVAAAEGNERDRIRELKAELKILPFNCQK